VNGPRLVATGSQTVGPFFHFALTVAPDLGVVAPPETPGERVMLRVRVVDGADVPVSDCMVEIWQADAEGNYVDTAGDSGRVFTGFGRLPTDADGQCTFETIRPGHVPDAEGRLQAAHVNVRLFMRGLLRHIHTRAYFPDDARLAEDPVMALVPADRRATLFVRPGAGTPGLWAFDVHLQGDQETVFFDL